ncbi:hypothetical protein CPB84DRAFT_1859220 [Gymnopilus junonius]|uniref:Uncharacterized protein n=1 Tax=Gymnopilus junonius TaxID=109634 RepID=A0A9P5N6C9_GYMJU|nr:hypothetical protein CPB84DRAFT_1859220 [Gymnopilus junonius]
MCFGTGRSSEVMLVVLVEVESEFCTAASTVVVIVTVTVTTSNTTTSTPATFNFKHPKSDSSVSSDASHPTLTIHQFITGHNHIQIGLPTMYSTTRPTRTFHRLQAGYTRPLSHHSSIAPTAGPMYNTPPRLPYHDILAGAATPSPSAYT